MSEKNNLVEFKGPFAATHAKKNDSGYDFVAQSMTIVGDHCGDGLFDRIDYIEYDTGVAVSPLDSHIWSIAAPNSRATKMNLILGNSVGIIDNSYQGTIKFRYKYIAQPSEMVIVDGKIKVAIDPRKIFHPGDTVGQLVFTKYIPVTLIKVDEFSQKTDRGEGGFGSTEKPRG